MLHFNKNKLIKTISFPNILLYKISKSILIITYNIIYFINNLLYVMKNDTAVGLSSVQLSYLFRIIIINFYKYKNLLNNQIYLYPCIMINPEIINLPTKLSTYPEGCLSFKSLFFKVDRFSQITIKYFNLFGELKFLKLSNNIIVSCVLHEIDHMNGILFINRISKIKRSFILNRILNNRYTKQS